MPFCFVNYENLQNLYFESRYHNHLCEAEHIQQQTFRPKFHKNLTLLGVVDSLLLAGDQ